MNQYTPAKLLAPPTWWTITKGDKLALKGQAVMVVYIGHNKGPDTIVRVQIPGRLKAKQVRIKDLAWLS